MASTTIELVKGNSFQSERTEIDICAYEKLLSTLKYAVFTAAAFALYSNFGLVNVLLLCLAVVLGDCLAFLLRQNFKLSKGAEIAFLAMNSVCWLQPVLGLFIAAATFGIGNSGMEEPKRAMLYRLCALLAIATSVVYLALAKLVA